MRLEVCDIEGGSGSVVALSGEVGFGEVQELKIRLDSALKLGGKALLLDLAKVSFIASDGLGALIRTRAHAERLGRRPCWCARRRGFWTCLRRRN